MMSIATTTSVTAIKSTRATTGFIFGPCTTRRVGMDPRPPFAATVINPDPAPGVVLSKSAALPSVRALKPDEANDQNGATNTHENVCKTKENCGFHNWSLTKDGVQNV